MKLQELCEAATEVQELHGKRMKPIGKQKDVIDVFKLDQKELDKMVEEEAETGGEPCWVHIAGALLGAKKISDMIYIDSEDFDYEDYKLARKHFKWKKTIKIDLGYNSIQQGTLGGGVAVAIDDRGYGAVVMRFK